MKKLLMVLAWMAGMGASMTSCVSTYRPYYGYDDFGNVVYYDIYDDYGYTYSYDAAVITEITNRMVLEMRLSTLEAQRLLDLNRRYYYLFHRYPSYSWGYYAQPRPGYARPGYGGRGPGYLAPPPGGRDPYMRIEGGRPVYYNVNTRQGSDNRVMMTSKQMEQMADQYDREVKKLVSPNQYNSFRTQTSNRTSLPANNTVGTNYNSSSRTTTTSPSTSNNGGRVSGTTTPSTTTTRQGTTSTRQGTSTQPSSAGSRVQQRAGSSTTPTTTSTRTSTTTSRQQTTTPTTTTRSNTTTSSGSTTNNGSGTTTNSGGGARRR